MVRIVFMGTPEFAVPSLRALHGRYEVTLVVTQPDRAAGRGRTLAEPAVKIAARDLGLPVYQPDSLRSPQALERLRALAESDLGRVTYHQGEEWTPRKVVRRMLEHEREHIAQLRQLIQEYQRQHASAD